MLNTCSMSPLLQLRPLKIKRWCVISVLGIFSMLCSWPQLQAQQQLFDSNLLIDSLTKVPATVVIEVDTMPRFTPRIYVTLLASDIKQQLTAPFRVKRKDIVQLGGLALTTFALSRADQPINRFATNLVANNPVVGTASNFITRFGGKYELYTLAAIGAWSVIGKNKKLANTTLLATQAYLAGGLLATGLKFMTGRQRPNYFNPITQRSSPVFHGPFYQFKKDVNGFRPNKGSYTAFPSGHTTVAFAAATVFAMEYRNKPLVPVLAYGAATFIGLSRITENKHWATDVFIGAVLGFLSGKQVVTNYHRYFNAPKTPKPASYKWKLNATYQNAHFVPGAVLTF